MGNDANSIPLLSQSSSLETSVMIEQWKTELCGARTWGTHSTQSPHTIFMESLKYEALMRTEGVRAHYTRHRHGSRRNALFSFRGEGSYRWRNTLILSISRLDMQSCIGISVGTSLARHILPPYVFSSSIKFPLPYLQKFTASNLTRFRHSLEKRLFAVCKKLKLSLFSQPQRLDLTSR